MKINEKHDQFRSRHQGHHHQLPTSVHVQSDSGTLRNALSTWPHRSHLNHGRDTWPHRSHLSQGTGTGPIGGMATTRPTGRKTGTVPIGRMTTTRTTGRTIGRATGRGPIGRVTKGRSTSGMATGGMATGMRDEVLAGTQPAG